ncbi:missing minor mitochondria isoform X2 [Lycorma delicatula]
MGYIPFGGKPDEYLICLTIDGRDTVIKKLRKLRESCMVKIGKLKFLEPGKWKSLGSEKEIEEFYYHNTRPLMNLEWVTKLSLRNVDLPKFQDFDAGTHRMTYNSIHFTGEKPELIYRMTIEQGVQTHEPKLDKQSQTIPQIPTNAAIQCVPETEIPEDAKERAASFSEEKLNEFMKKYSDFLMNQLHYNEVYDLYNDEYPQLAEISQQLLVPLPDFYEQYQNFTDVAAVEGKSIVSSAWSTKYSGIVAVAYADEVNNQLKYLDSEFDDIDGEPDYESDSTNSEKSDDDDSSADEGEKWLAAEKKEKESRKTKNEDDVAFQRANAKIKQLQLVRALQEMEVKDAETKVLPLKRKQCKMNSNRLVMVMKPQNRMILSDGKLKIIKKKFKKIRRRKNLMWELKRKREKLNMLLCKERREKILDVRNTRLRDMMMSETESWLEKFYRDLNKKEMKEKMFEEKLKKSRKIMERSEKMEQIEKKREEKVAKRKEKLEKMLFKVKEEVKSKKLKQMMTKMEKAMNLKELNNEQSGEEEDKEIEERRKSSSLEITDSKQKDMESKRISKDSKKNDLMKLDKEKGNKIIKDEKGTVKKKKTKKASITGSGNKKIKSKKKDKKGIKSEVQDTRIVSKKMSLKRRRRLIRTYKFYLKLNKVKLAVMKNNLLKLQVKKLETKKAVRKEKKKTTKSLKILRKFLIKTRKKTNKLRAMKSKLDHTINKIKALKFKLKFIWRAKNISEEKKERVIVLIKDKLKKCVENLKIIKENFKQLKKGLVKIKVIKRMMNQVNYKMAGLKIRQNKIVFVENILNNRIKELSNEKLVLSDKLYVLKTGKLRVHKPNEMTENKEKIKIKEQSNKEGKGTASRKPKSDKTNVKAKNDVIKEKEETEKQEKKSKKEKERGKNKKSKEDVVSGGKRKDGKLSKKKIVSGKNKTRRAKRLKMARKNYLSEMDKKKRRILYLKYKAKVESERYAAARVQKISIETRVKNYKYITYKSILTEPSYKEMSDKRKELEEKRRVDSLSIFSLQTPSSSVEPKGSEKADRQFLKEEKKEKIRTDLVLGISNKARRLTDFDVFMSREKLKRRVYERGKTKESVGRRKRILVPVSTSLDDETESLCAIWGDNYNWVHEASLRSAIRRMHIHHKRKRRAFQSVRPLLANIPWPQIYPMNDNIDVEQSTSERSSHQRTSPSVHISSSSAGVSVSRHPSKSSTIMSTSSKFKKEMRHKHRTIPKFDHSITEHYDEVIDFDEVQAKREELPILLPNNPVLIWGFNDDLLPKLRLDCPFELTCIRFHLSNGNILVGCTKSGQVVLWDLRGRIEKVDEPPSINSEDEKHRMKLSEWMHWTKDIRSKRRVPITAISSYYDSHVEQATNLQFVHPFLKFMPNGKVRNLEPGEPPSEQFVTSALSGSVLFWDLDITKIKRKQKRKKIVDQPSSLYVQHSPYDCLNNNWKPFLKVNVLTDELIPTPLLGLSLDVIPVNYNRITPEPPPGKPDSLEDCIEYAADYSDVPKFSYTFTIGTARGNVGLLTLQPENMPSGVIEIPITQNWFKNMHDGPVTHIYKNPFINELIITSGGHVWAIWHTDYVEYPIIWRKYHNVRITCCLWSTFRPSLFRIAKSCGSIEIWDLLRQSHKPQKEITVSGQLITDLSGPVLPLQHGILSAGDYNTALRLFYIPWQYQVWTEDELKKFTSMIHYEPGRQKNLKKWRDWWREKYGRKTVKRKELQEQRRKEEEQRVKEDEARKKYNEEVYKWYMRRRGKQFVFAEEAKAKFEAKQREHMFNVVVSKKKIDRTQMEKLVQPLVKIEKLEKLRQEKVKERLKHADELFNQAVIKIFPKGLEEEDIIQQDETDLIKRVLLEVDYKFGPDMEKLKDEILQEIYKNKWECSKRWPQLFAEYTASREVFNKPLNRRKMSTRWLRKKLLKSLTEEGNRIIQYKSKKEVYAEMKYKNREKRLTELKEMYGENYIPDWNKHKKITRFNDWKEMILQPPEVHLIEEKITMKKREESDEDLQETKKELVKEISEKELVKEISEKELVKELSEKDLVKELSEKEEMLLEDVDLLEVLQTLSLTSTVQKEKLKEISDISELDIDTELIIDETRRSDLLPVLPSPTGLSDLSLKPDSQTSLFYSEKNMEIDPIPHGFTSTKLSIGRPIEMVKNLQQVVKAVREESGKIEEMHESEEEQYEGEDEEYSETKERKSKPDEEREKMRQIEEQEKGEEHERRKTTQHRETTELKRGHDHEPQVKEEEDIDDSASIDEEETENEKRLEQID